MERRLIGGRYELLEQIGGSSWRATDTELGRDVFMALPARGGGAAMLSHPSIVRLFDQGEDNGTPYAVFEYLPGGSLEQRLALGPLPGSEASEVALDVAAALTYAHEQWVTHGAVGAANPSLTLGQLDVILGYLHQVRRDLDELVADLAARPVHGPRSDDGKAASVSPRECCVSMRRRIEAWCHAYFIWGDA